MTRYIEIEADTGKVLRQLDVPAEELMYYATPGQTFLRWEAPIPNVAGVYLITVNGESQLTIPAPELTIADVRNMRSARLTTAIQRLDADTKRQELGLPSAMTPAKRAEWLAYYQALCDVPQNFVPGVDLVWPTPPSE